MASQHSFRGNTIKITVFGGASVHVSIKSLGKSVFLSGMIDDLGINMNKEITIPELNDALRKPYIFSQDELEIFFKIFDMDNKDIIFRMFDNGKNQTNLEIIKKYLLFANFLDNQALMNTLIEYVALSHKYIIYTNDNDTCANIVLIDDIIDAIYRKIIQNLINSDERKKLMDNIKLFHVYHTFMDLPQRLQALYTTDYPKTSAKYSLNNIGTVL